MSTTDSATETAAETDTQPLAWTPRIRVEKIGYRDLVQALETDIRLGLLNPGAQLPTHRELSKNLGISRGTVARAYDEAQRLGLLESGIGRGTFVADDYAVRTRQPQRSELIDMGLGFPLYELDPDPGPLLEELARDPARLGLLRYPPPGGEPSHRHSGARWCRALGVEADIESIFVTLGAQHSAHLWMQTVLRPGEVLLAEELTYRMVVSAAETLGIRIEAVAMDEHGISPEALDEVAERTGARGLFLMPTIQNPTTVTLDEDRRREILDIADRHRLQILEDDINGFYHSEPRPRPLKALRPERVTYVASLSKTLAGGLRVGFAVPPEDWRPGFRTALLGSIYSAPSFSTELAARWIEDGTARTTIEEKKREAALRWSLLESELGPWVPELRGGACYAWMRLPAPWTATRFALEARRRGVSVMPAEAFYIGHQRPPECLRLSFGAVTRQQLEQALEILGNLLRDPTAAHPIIV